MSENSAEVKSENSVEPETQSEQPEEKPSGRGKRSAGKRLSMLTRTAQEGEAILKITGDKELCSGDIKECLGEYHSGMGHKEEAAEGRRTTRSSTRGSTGTQATPPPAKRERKTPAGKGSSRRGRPKRDEPEEENEVDTDDKVESKAEEKKEQKEENGKVEETDQKENNVDDTDGGGDGKSMEVDESDTPASVDSEKPTDNGPSEHPSSPVQKENEISKPEEPEKLDNETKNEESSKQETVENSEADTREAPPPQSD